MLLNDVEYWRQVDVVDCLTLVIDVVDCLMLLIDVVDCLMLLLLDAVDAVVWWYPPVCCPPGSLRPHLINNQRLNN